MALRGFKIVKQRGTQHETFTQRVLCVEGIHVFQPAKLCCRCIFTEHKPINKKSCANLIGTDFCGKTSYFLQLVKRSSMVENPGPQIPAQVQRQHPGAEHPMQPRPQFFSTAYKPAGKLDGRVALITGGDSGIGRSVACLYALEGADVAIVYKGQIEEEDKDKTLQVIHKLTNGKAKVIACYADMGFDDQCKRVVDSVVQKFGRIDILVNNAAEQFYKESIEEITPKQLERTFRSNIFSQFFLTRHCLRHMKEGSCIINTASIVAYRGEASLLDYCSTKGAIVSFTRGLALQLAKRGIRVNGVAPGPNWTPLIPASFPADMVEKGKWGENVSMKRPGQPFEVATSYVFLASQDASYITGQVLHPNGGAIVNA